VAAVGAPATTIGDPAELLDVHVDQLTGAVAFVAHAVALPALITAPLIG
jgi:hypothetical protein